MSFKFQIKGRWDSLVKFECELSAEYEKAPESHKLGQAVKQAYLQGADLQGADLRSADLRSAYLRSAYLQGADLQGADLQGADLRSAYLQGADLQGADLRSADLRSAYLQGADLQGADLQGAHLRSAYLQGADLQGADLQGAYLQGADLQGALNKDEAKWPHFQIIQEGSIIVWKKLRGSLVCKLEIPADAKRTASVVGRKCRAEFAKVVQIVGKSSGIFDEGSGLHNGTIYKVGEIVRADKYDPDFTVECSGGIHFFQTREEAEEYNG